MPDVVEVLWCKACDRFAVVVAIDAPSDQPTQCACGHKSTAGHVRGLMQMYGKEPRRQADYEK